MLKAHTGTVRCVAFSNDGRMLLSASDDKTVKVRYKGHRKDLHDLGCYACSNSAHLSPREIMAQVSSSSTPNPHSQV